MGIGRRFSEEVWKEIIAEMDMNQDGTISFDEFQTMMTKLLVV